MESASSSPFTSPVTFMLATSKITVLAAPPSLMNPLPSSSTSAIPCTVSIPKSFRPRRHCPHRPPSPPCRVRHRRAAHGNPLLDSQNTPGRHLQLRPAELFSVNGNELPEDSLLPEFQAAEQTRNLQNGPKF